MKKLATLLLALNLMLSLVSCDSEKTPSTSQNTSAASKSEENTNNENLDESENTEEFESTEESHKEITFEEPIVAVDNAECSIKITGITSDALLGYSLKAQIENKSAEKTYTFSVDSATINGVHCEPWFSPEVPAGKKANDEIALDITYLEKNGIVEYTDIELTFDVYDSNDYEADSVAFETINVYPYGKEKATKYVRESQPNDNVIIDNEYVTVIVTGYEKNDYYYEAMLFLLNKTDKTVMFSTDDASVNGYMVDPFYADLVFAGKCAFSSISWDNTDLEENEITEVEEIEFMLKAYDWDDSMSDDFVNEKITLNP